MTDQSEQHIVGFHPQWRTAISRAWVHLSVTDSEAPTPEALDSVPTTAGQKE